MEKFWAGGFLYNPKNNSVLLHKRDSNTKFNPNSWAFFGGLNKKSETPINCFIREIKEELGIELREQEIIKLCDYLNTEFNTYRYVFYAISEKDKSEFVLNEGKNFDWVSIDRLDEYDSTQKTKKDSEFFRGKILKELAESRKELSEDKDKC